MCSEREMKEREEQNLLSIFELDPEKTKYDNKTQQYIKKVKPEYAIQTYTRPGGDLNKVDNSDLRTPKALRDTMNYIINEIIDSDHIKNKKFTKLFTIDFKEICLFVTDRFRAIRKYFPILDNVLCLPCNNDITGQSGCNGKCNLNNGVFSCESGCKEGYYNLSNYCQKCSDYEQYCEKCTYNPPSEYYSSYTDYSYYNCTQCESSKSILVGRWCNRCYLSNCEQCHFENENSICDKCYSGYYLKNKTCTKCNWILETEGKVCEICSDDLKNDNAKSCNCTTHYTEGDSKQCIKCPENCYSCSNKNGNLKCLSCDNGYILNSKGVCVTCGDNCDFCYLDSNENPNCLYCKSPYKLNKDKNCLECPNHCQSCIKGNNNINECTICENYYGLLPNKTCQRCPINCLTCFWKEEKGEFGCSSCYYTNYKLDEDDKCISPYEMNKKCDIGCSDCYYDKFSPDMNKYKCNKCSGNNYVYIDNEYKCYSNTNSSQEYFYHCINAIFNSSTNQYECLKCESGYIYILDEKKCFSREKTDLGYYCEKAKN